MSKTYNGYANWETWNVVLWFNNEEPLYRLYRVNAPFDPATVETFVRHALPNGTPDFDHSWEYDKVDWSEVSEAFNEV